MGDEEMKNTNPPPKQIAFITLTGPSLRTATSNPPRINPLFGRSFCLGGGIPLFGPSPSQDPVPIIRWGGLIVAVHGGAGIGRVGTVWTETGGAAWTEPDDSFA